MTVTIYTGDCRELLRTLPDESVHCCVTSPPYYGLRDYGVEGQMGMEKTPEAFVASMVAVFGEVRRVLRNDGTLWLNIGDSYAARRSSQPADMGSNSTLSGHARAAGGHARMVPTGYKAKDMLGIPWMLAFALRADGWYLRQEIIWHKKNPMPESVRDRCTKAHESLFLLSKSPRYYFDAEAIAEPAVYGATPSGVGFGHGFDAQPKPRKKVPSGWDTGNGNHDGRVGNYNRPSQPKGSFDGKTGDKAFRKTGETRNKRSVWTIPTQPFSEAHFATFPVALVEPCILAGSPVGGLVLDPFGGSGTTGLVAEDLGRDSVLIELKPAYADMAARRTRQGGLVLGATA